MRTLLFVAGCITVNSAAAQEMSAGRNQLQEDTHSIAMSMDAKNNAIMVILQKLTACNALGKFYRPNVADADANGCVGEAIPSGTVGAFRLSACPRDWSAYTAGRGRVIVGVGSLSGETYTLGQVGGAAERTLTVAQLPSHRHSFDYTRTVSSPIMLSADDNDQAMWTTTVSNDRTDYTGGGDPFDNRQPYVTLLYCIKD